MTLIELYVILAMLIGLVAGVLIALDLDLGPDLVVPLLLAFFAQCAALVGLCAALGVIEYIHSWRTGRPHWPACGHCGAGAFSVDIMHIPTIVTCPCGAQYVRHGLEYREVLPGGASRRYLRWVPFRRWIDVRTADTTPAPAPYRGSGPPR